jgi:predicted phage-related endonuclease
MPVNTLAIAKRMTEAGFTPKQAETHAELMAEIVESDLATKRDLKDVETKLTRDIKEVEAKLSRDIKELDVKLSREIKEVEARLSRDIKELDVKLSRDIKELELKFGGDLKSEIKGLETKMMQVVLGTGAFVVAVLGIIIRYSGR